MYFKSSPICFDCLLFWDLISDVFSSRVMLSFFVRTYSSCLRTKLSKLKRGKQNCFLICSISWSIICYWFANLSSSNESHYVITCWVTTGWLIHVINILRTINNLCMLFFKYDVLTQQFFSWKTIDNDLSPHYNSGNNQNH